MSKSEFKKFVSDLTEGTAVLLKITDEAEVKRIEKALHINLADELLGK